MYTNPPARVHSKPSHAAPIMWLSPTSILIWMALAGVAGVEAARDRNSDREGRSRNREDRRSRNNGERNRGAGGRQSGLTPPANNTLWTLTTAPPSGGLVIPAGTENPREPHPTQPESIPGRRKLGDTDVGCKELRSKRYISDGHCTSTKPVTEVICTGHCLPIRSIPWYARFVKVWAKTKIMEYRCVEDRVRRKRVKLHCPDGMSRSYKIKVVKSCKCKKYMNSQNASVSRYTNRHKRPRRREENRSDLDTVVSNGSLT